MEVQEIDVRDVYPYENNPRKNADAVKYVMESIKEFGFKQPIVLDKNHVIVVGHTRFAAAKKLGMKTVPCVVAEDMTEEQANAYRLVDNKTNEFSSWDVTALNEELDALYASFNMDKFGFPIQIENIDMKGELEEAEQKFARELDEANNYIVLEFGTETDWERAQELFGLEKQMRWDKNPKQRRYGIGRVISGAKWLDVLERARDNEH